jgi:lysophospholipase L1-like esterase
MPYHPIMILKILGLFALGLQGCVNTTPNPIKPDVNKPMTFHFIGAKASYPNNRFSVTGDSIYSPEQGYGFDLDTDITPEGKPFYFSVQLPEGNYKVDLEFGSSTQDSSNTVRAESRRLLLENIKTAAGEFITQSAVVNIRTGKLTPPELNAPGGIQVVLKNQEKNRLHWDDKLTLEFNGSAPQVRSVSIQKIDVPTIYLVGDSTVTDQAYEPAASWGQMLPRFFNSDIAIANHAESGETLKSFIASLRFAKVLETLKQGDYLLIQFGHNDQKKHWPQTYAEAQTTYKDYLRVFISEARLRGATPVLITSMQRRTFDSNGKIQNSHGLYPQAVREVAKEKNVALIDLDAMSIKLYEALGINKAPLAFNDNGKDATHHNNYGAYQLALCVVQAIRDLKLPLVKQLRNSTTRYDPANPENPEHFQLNSSPQMSSARPAGN